LIHLKVFSKIKREVWEVLPLTVLLWAKANEKGSG
jgi:hypothetical protein